MPRLAIHVPCAEFDVREICRPAGYAMEVFEEHPDYEIYCQLSGAARWQCDETEYIIHAGSVLLLGENCPHKAQVMEAGPFRGLVLHFSGAYMDEVGLAFPKVDFEDFLNRRSAVHLGCLTGQEQQLLETMLRQLLLLKDRPGPQGEAARKLLLGALLLLLQPMCDHAAVPLQAETDHEKAAQRLTRQVQAYLAEHYAQPLTLPGVAALFRVSAPYLSRAFHKAAGVSFVEYLNLVRVKAAQEALHAPNVRVESVAKQCGFGTQAHFRRVFKAAIGVSPGQYRKRALTEAQAPALLKRVKTAEN